MAPVRKKDGHTRAYSKGGGWYSLALDEFARVRGEWMAGRAFVDTIGVQGEPITLKLAEVQAVSQMTADTLDAMREDEAADAREQRERELLDGSD